MNLADLHIAMSNDETLLDMVADVSFASLEDMFADSDPGQR